LKILIPQETHPDSFTDNVEVTLWDMGHTVRSLGTVAPKRFGSLRTLIRSAGEAMIGYRASWRDRLAVKVAREFRPDVVLGLTASLHSETLELLGQICQGRRFLWWGDSPANSHRWGMVDPGWDRVFVKDRAAVSKLRLIGRDAVYLPEAMNPRWHRPLMGQSGEHIAVVGSFYAFRQALCLRLINASVPVRLYGLPLPMWGHPELKRRFPGNYVVLREEKSKVFGAALGCLNSFSLAEGNSLNCRTFEIAGAAGFQLIERRPALEECFEPGKEVVAFESFEELLSAIERANRDRGWTTAIRLAGAKRALAEHTYKHRLTTILEGLS